jgi:hypothetical protein
MHEKEILSQKVKLLEKALQEIDKICNDLPVEAYKQCERIRNTLRSAYLTPTEEGWY